MQDDLNGQFGEAQNDTFQDEYYNRLELRAREGMRQEAREMSRDRAFLQMFMSLADYDHEGDPIEVPSDPEEKEAYWDAIDRGEREFRKMSFKDQREYEQKFGLDKHLNEFEPHDLPPYDKHDL